MSKRSKYYLIIVLLAFALVFSIGFNCKQFRDNTSLKGTIATQQNKIKQQKEDVVELENTKDVRNFNGMKNETNRALNGAANALFTYKGMGYAKRYIKAEKYMDHDVLVGLSTNGQIPSQKDMEEAAKDKAAVHTVSKVVEVEDGIQKIDGNTVSGFAWLVMQYGEYNKKNGITVSQIKYQYSLVKHKFTSFKAEPFSGTISD